MNEVHEQRVEADDLDIAYVVEDLGSHRDALGEVEQRALGRALGDGQDDLVEEAGSATHEVFVAAGHRVECPRVDRHAMIQFVHAVSRRIR